MGFFNSGPVLHVVLVTPFIWISIYSCLSSWTWIPHVLDFICSPHYPSKSLIRLLLLHTRAGRLSYSAPCRQSKPVAPGAHLAHGTEREREGGREGRREGRREGGREGGRGG